MEDTIYYHAGDCDAYYGGECSCYVRKKVAQREHITDGEECWCFPVTEETEGGKVIIHHLPN